MRKTLIMIAAVGTAMTFAMAGPAAAKGGPGGGFGGGPGWKASNPPGFAQGRKVGWGTAGYPPGWSKGRKTGWHGSTRPPGWSRY